MSERNPATRLRLDVSVDRQRQVVSLNFISDDATTGAKAQYSGVPPVVSAAKLIAAEPNIVIKLDDDGRLIGIDVFEAASTFGLDELEDIAMTLRTGG